MVRYIQQQFVTLLGKEVTVGDTAQDFTVLAEPFESGDTCRFERENLVKISVIPSICIVGVCSVETRKFNEEAASLGDDVQVLTLSADCFCTSKMVCS